MGPKSVARGVVCLALLFELVVGILVAPTGGEGAGAFGFFKIPSSWRASSMMKNLSYQTRTVSGALEILVSSSTLKASHSSHQWTRISR